METDGVMRESAASAANTSFHSYTVYIYNTKFPHTSGSTHGIKMSSDLHQPLHSVTELSQVTMTSLCR